MALVPSVEIPSGVSLSVRIIDTTPFLKIPIALFMGPPMPGFTHFEGSMFSFLLEHPSGRKLLFDMGVRKDWANLASPILKLMQGLGWKVNVEKNMIEILEENGVKGEDIEAIIWR
jgi:hypothetical protein